MNTKIDKINALSAELDKVVIGYSHIKRQIILALLADGHVLLESMPGLAKTTLISTLQAAIEGARQNRIQMTPDLKPTDIIGVQIFNQKTGEFETQTGPMIGTNLLLADEVNRTTPKTLSAMLQAMQERYVTIGGVRYDLEDPFLVLATMNPVEQEGTFPLPEAMLDRFCFKLVMDYVSRNDEINVAKNTKVHGRDAQRVIEKALSTADILAMREKVLTIADQGAKDALVEYIVDLVRATRPTDPAFKNIKDKDGETFSEKVAFGASPRCIIWTLRTAAALAFLDGRDHITPDDVKSVFRDVCRHRIILTQDAALDGFTTDKFIQAVLAQVPVIERKSK